jgi:hypothetical protein
MKKCAVTECIKSAELHSNYCEDHQKKGAKETRIYKEKNTENNTP